MKVDVSAFAVIFCDYKILLVRRSLLAEAYPGRWDLPGGALDTTELTLEDVVRRVVHEQTGLLVMPEVMIDNKRKGNTMQVAFSARLQDEMMRQPLLAPELMSYKWATRKQTENMKMTPHTRQRLKEVFDYMLYMPSYATLR